MPRAFCLIRNEPHYRRHAFERGLAAAGYQIHGPPHGAITREDVLLIWNRYGRYHTLANDFENRGARVIVAENGLLGRDWRGGHWYSVALSAPAAVGGTFVDGGPGRWDSWGVEICSWRKEGGEVIVLAQRGIGPPGTAQPPGWHQQIAANLQRLLPDKVRIREHPGERPCIPLDTDLRNARAVVTWASGAALKALLAGIPTYYGLSRWIGAGMAQPVTQIEQPQAWPDRRALAFGALAWSTWTTEELAGGQPFERLLA